MFNPQKIFKGQFPVKKEREHREPDKTIRPGKDNPQPEDTLKVKEAL